MRVLCVVLLPVGLLGLIDVLLLDSPSSAHWWQHDGGVFVLSAAAVLIGLVGLWGLIRRPHSGESVDEHDSAD